MYREQLTLLSTQPPRPRQEVLALLVALLLLAAFLIVLPFAHIPMGRLDVFIPIVATVMFLNDSITAALLFAQFAILRGAGLLVLATGYLMTGLLVVPYALTFPGAFSPAGWLGAGLQSTTWLFTAWHFAVPLTAFAYALLNSADASRQVAHGSVRMAILGSVTGVVCAVAGLTFFVTVHHDALPAVLKDPAQFSLLWIALITPVSALLCIVVIALFLARRRSLLDLWLLVVAWAWLLKSILLVFIKYRYSVAWYANSLFAVSAATFVLIVLLSETTVMYARLALSIIAQQREREGRLMTIDAVTASIAHEVNQPLGAIVTNGGAGLRWLSRASPDLGKAREALQAIVDDGHRASQVIAGMRAMLRRDAAEKRWVDLNDAIMEVLLLMQRELGTRGVAVDTALDSKLPPVRANKVQLQQVLLNLIGNAIEAMHGGTSRDRLLRVHTQRHGKEEVLVTVEDTGPGIDPNDRDRIFDPLFTTKSGGMGLGLSISRSIAEAHRGRIWATPGVTCGTVFQFVLPAGSGSTDV
jgi:signal transduction histidine kinase